MNNKKIIALALSVALVFSLCSALAASAAEAFEWVVEPTLVYEEVYCMKEGLWKGWHDGQVNILDLRSGQANIISTEYNDAGMLTDDLFYVTGGYRVYGVIDMNGNEIIPVKYSDISALTDTQLLVFEGEDYFDRLYGVIDINGNEIIPLRHENGYIDKLTDSLLCVVVGENYSDTRYGVIDVNGNEVIPPIYRDISKLTDTLLIVCINDGDHNYRYGVIDVNGNEVIPIKYGYIDKLTDTLLSVEDKNTYRCSVMDMNGNELIPPKYTYLYSLTDTMIFVEEMDDNYNYHYGIVDMYGNEIIPVKYDALYTDTDTLFGVGKEFDDGRFLYGVIDINGNEIIPVKYDEIRVLTDTLFSVGEGEEYFDRLYGIIDINENVIVSPKYDYISPLTDTLLRVTEISDDYEYSYSIININGEAVLPAGYTMASYEVYETPEGVIAMVQSPDGMIGFARIKTTASAAESDISVQVNGKAVEFDQPPVAQDGRTLVPVRAVFEAMGCDVGYENGLVSIKADDRTIEIMLGGTDVTISEAQPDGKLEETVWESDVPAQAINGRTLVPVRVLSEALGYDVDWDNDTRTVIITTR